VVARWVLDKVFAGSIAPARAESFIWVEEDDWMCSCVRAEGELVPVQDSGFFGFAFLGNDACDCGCKGVCKLDGLGCLFFFFVVVLWYRGMIEGFWNEQGRFDGPWVFSEACGFLLREWNLGRHRFPRDFALRQVVSGKENRTVCIWLLNAPMRWEKEDGALTLEPGGARSGLLTYSAPIRAARLSANRRRRFE